MIRRDYLYRIHRPFRHGTRLFRDDLVSDATAAFSHQMMHAAHKLNGPTYAHAILTTAELIEVLPKASASTETMP